MARIQNVEIEIHSTLIDCLALAYPALKHAAGHYGPDELVLTVGQVRAECRKAYLAIEATLQPYGHPRSPSCQATKEGLVK